ncbi:MAG: hypothetical protein Q4F65_06765 [Propionibacteriaceae bacterium]|nr:hypothetical protein [Propionibacteriaceae bacterium]
MTTVPRWVLILFRAAGLFTLFAVVGGALVAATESGFECGNWPGCDADAILPGGAVNEILYRNPWIEMTHRASAVLSGPLALASAIVATRLRGVHPLVKILPWVTVVGAIIAGYVGRGIVLGEVYPTWVGALDLGAALVALVAMTTATIALERTPAQWFPTRAGILAWAGLGSLFVMHLAGLYAAGPNSFTRVVAWPVWRILEADTQGSIVAQWLRFPLVALAAVLLVLAAREAKALGLWREGITVVVLTVACLAFGAGIAATGTDALGVPFALCAVAAFFTTILLAARATVLGTGTTPTHGMSTTTPAAESGTRQRP